MHLTSSDAGADIAHSVVVTDLLVQIVGEGLARLSCKLEGVARIGFFLAEEHTAARGRDYLVSVEGKNAEFAEGTAGAALIKTAESLGGVLDEGDIMLAADCGDLVELGGIAVEMDDNDRFRHAVEIDRTAQSLGIHIPGLALRVDEDGLGADVGDGIGGRGEGQILTKNGVTGPDAREDHRKMKSRGARRKSDGVCGAREFLHRLLEFIYVFAKRRDPVFCESIADIFKLVALLGHMRRGKVDAIRHDFRPSKIEVRKHFSYLIISQYPLNVNYF